jgi:hypothetical protein
MQKKLTRSNTLLQNLELLLEAKYDSSIYGAEYYLRAHKLCSPSIISQHFMEPEGSLPRSQELSTCTYPEPDQFSQRYPILSKSSILMCSS